MAASIDLQAPHAGDTVPHSFPAGGTYELPDRYKREDHAPPQQVGLVVCRLFDATGHLLDTQSAPVMDGLSPAPWAALLSSHGTNAEHCRVEAELQLYDEPLPHHFDAATDIDVRDTANGMMLPPPFGFPHLANEFAEETQGRAVAVKVYTPTGAYADAVVVTLIRRRSKSTGSAMNREVQVQPLTKAAQSDVQGKDLWEGDFTHACVGCVHPGNFRPVARARVSKAGRVLALMSIGYAVPT